MGGGGLCGGGGGGGGGGREKRVGLQERNLSEKSSCLSV